MSNLTAHQEDILTLRNILGMDEQSAENVLEKTVVISFVQTDTQAKSLFCFLRDILSRTVSQITDELQDNPDAEIIINNFPSRTEAKKIFVAIGEDRIEISTDNSALPNKFSEFHRSLLLLGACYISAFLMRYLIGKNSKLPPVKNNFVLDLKAIFPDTSFFNKEVDLEKTYVAGAGAIGNAFLYALKEFDVKGILIIADQDYVTEGNLNRCIWFDKSMLSENKAEVLARVAQDQFPKLKLVPHPDFLNTILEKEKDPKWLRRLIVGVDSRRARRHIQAELPKEVFDASTTNIEEIILHYHIRPINGSACLECIYPHNTAESAHERHLAESLGISLSDIQELYITEKTAKKIKAKFPTLAEERLVNQSFDTLFKALCGQGKLQTQERKQIFAPFSFVSIMAGTYLAIETIRRISSNEHNYNYWRLSPWTPPLPRLRQFRPKNKNCSFCNNRSKSKYAEELWS